VGRSCSSESHRPLRRLPGLNVTGDQRREFLCRADARNLFETAEEFNGLKIGKRESGTISARLYDKTIESPSPAPPTGRKCGARPSILGFSDARRVRAAPRGPSPVRCLDPDEVLTITGSMCITSPTTAHAPCPHNDETKARWPISGPGKSCSVPASAAEPSASNAPTG